MVIIIAGGVIGFLAGGILGGASFGPVGSLAGSILGTAGGLGMGAILRRTFRARAKRAEPDAEADPLGERARRAVHGGIARTGSDDPAPGSDAPEDRDQR